MAKQSERIDQQLARTAIDKRRRGERPTREEAAALRRVEKAHEEEVRWQHYRSIPAKHWREMSGRQARTINEQASRYGIPFSGRSIDLTAVVPALHDFFSRHGKRLAQLLDEQQGDQQTALERYREENYRLRRLERLEREGQLLPRERVHEALTRAAGVLRQAGDTLQKQFGSAAYDILERALDDVLATVDDLANDDRDAAADRPNR